MAVSLPAAGATMWSLDILTGPLLLSPLLRRSPVQIVVMMIREGGIFEAVQYLVAMLGVLAARDQPWALLLLLAPAALVYTSFRNSTQARIQAQRTLEDLADTVDRRDIYSLGHSHRVADMTRETLRALSKRGPELDILTFAARIHDIGMLGIPDDIIRTPAQRTAAISAVLSSHAEKGADLCARYPDLEPAARSIRHQCEMWDGSGSPHRLRGTEIPLGSRVIAVVEAYDAMTTDHSQRSRMTPAHAASILREGRGTRWDADIVDAFLRTIQEQIDSSMVPTLRLVRDEEPQDEIG